MSKELEALEYLKPFRWEDKKEKEAYELLKKALTPPTVDEVCKALSEYHLFDMVEYDKITQTFYIDCQDKHIIIFDYVLPHHLITLIGRFYQSLEEELK